MPGLSSVLSGNALLEGATQTPPELPRLHVLTAGPLPPIPADLLLSLRMTELLRWAAERYDYVLLDAPPVLGASDAVLLAAMVDGVFVVARYGKVPRRLPARSCTLLTGAQAPVYGLVVNGAPAGSAWFALRPAARARLPRPGALR